MGTMLGGGTPSTFILIERSTFPNPKRKRDSFGVAKVLDKSSLWSAAPSGVGTLSTGGLYTAPSSLTAQQTVVISATSLADTSKTPSAVVTLLPVPSSSNLALSATTQPPYTVGTTLGFNFSLTDQNGTPEAGIPLAISVVGVNPETTTLITGDNGMVAFNYSGVNGGKDTIQATATVSGQKVSSNIVAVSLIGVLPTNGQGTITLSPSSVAPTLGLEGLCGAFTDSNGSVIEPLDIGATQRVFTVPAGATQLQLGIDDGIYFDNFGQGFLVNANGVPVTVPAGAKPWTWVAGGLNSNYIFGIQDGTAPIVAATHLVAGQSVVIAYQSGLSSPGGSFAPIYNADGVLSVITGTGVSFGIANPTFYMTALSYTVGGSAQFTSYVTDSTGTPISCVPVVFTVAGANAQQFQVSTDATGTAVFSYTGAIAGTDTVTAQATIPGNSAITSSQTPIVWRGSTPLPLRGYLTLSPGTVQPKAIGGLQSFTVVVSAPSGNPLPNVGVILTVENVSALYLNATTNTSGQATFTYQDFQPGTDSVRAVATINGEVTYSNIVEVP